MERPQIDMWQLASVVRPAKLPSRTTSLERVRIGGQSRGSPPWLCECMMSLQGQKVHSRKPFGKAQSASPRPQSRELRWSCVLFVSEADLAMFGCRISSRRRGQACKA